VPPLTPTHPGWHHTMSHTAAVPQCSRPWRGLPQQWAGTLYASPGGLIPSLLNLYAPSVCLLPHPHPLTHPPPPHLWSAITLPQEGLLLLFKLSAGVQSDHHRFRLLLLLRLLLLPLLLLLLLLSPLLNRCCCCCPTLSLSSALFFSSSTGSNTLYTWIVEGGGQEGQAEGVDIQGGWYLTHQCKPCLVRLGDALDKHTTALAWTTRYGSCEFALHHVHILQGFVSHAHLQRCPYCHHISFVSHPCAALTPPVPLPFSLPTPRGVPLALPPPYTPRYPTCIIHTHRPPPQTHSLTFIIHTQLPMSLSLRVTDRPTPPPPHTRMLALSGSMAAAHSTPHLTDTQHSTAQHSTAHSAGKGQEGVRGTGQAVS